MMKNSYIAKHAKVFLVSLLLVFVIIQFIWGFSWFLNIFFLLILYLFRRSKIDTIADENAFISPISGKIDSIRVGSYSELGDCLEIRIINDILSEGNIISPIKTCVEEIKIKKGLFLCPFMKNTSLLGERVIFINSTKDKKWAMRVIFGALNRKTHIYDFARDLKVADEIGFMFDGSISLFLPKDTRICVNENDKIRVGGLIGYFDL